jgi:basic amino acid/polyamine antiporter, APA family
MVASLLKASARRKPIRVVSRATLSEDALKPLGLIDLIGIGVGGTLGSGLFLLAGRAAREVAGPGVTLSFALAAVACLFSGMSYAEMSSRDPNCGGAYAFAYSSLGELPAFLVGSCLTLEYGVASAAIARSWASYLGEAFHILPAWTVGRGDNLFSALACVLVLAITALLAAGMEEAKWVINTSTALYAGVVVIIIVVGSMRVDVDNWTPFLPFGTTGVLAGASHVFFSFIGFDEVATVAEEARDAARAVPLAMMISLAIVAVIYVAATLVLTGMQDYASIDLAAPFSAAFSSVNLPVVAKLVGLGTATGMLNTTLVSLAAQPRIFVSMGRDGLLPHFIASSMRVTTIRCGTVVALCALAAPTEVLADVVSGGTLLAFLATNLGLMNTRLRAHNGGERGVVWTTILAICCVLAGATYRLFTLHIIPVILVPIFAVPLITVPSCVLLRLDMRGGAEVEPVPPVFLCPFVPALPIFGAITTCFLMTQLPAEALYALIAWLGVSATVYFSYGAHNSNADADGDIASDDSVSLTTAGHDTFGAYEATTNGSSPSPADAALEF